MTKSKNKVSDTITVFCIACLGAGGRWAALACLENMQSVQRKKMTDQKTQNHDFARSHSNAGLGSKLTTAQ